MKQEISSDKIEKEFNVLLAQNKNSNNCIQRAKCFGNRRKNQENLFGSNRKEP